MGKEIDIERDGDDYMLLLDGEEQGLVDKDSLEKLTGDLYIHFNLFN